MKKALLVLFATGLSILPATAKAFGSYLSKILSKGYQLPMQQGFRCNVATRTLESSCDEYDGEDARGGRPVWKRLKETYGVDLRRLLPA